MTMKNRQIGSWSGLCRVEDAEIDLTTWHQQVIIWNTGYACISISTHRFMSNVKLKGLFDSVTSSMKLWATLDWSYFHMLGDLEEGGSGFYTYVLVRLSSWCRERIANWSYTPQLTDVSLDIHTQLEQFVFVKVAFASGLRDTCRREV